MIDKEQFYSEEDMMGRKGKNKIWNEIKNNLPVQKRRKVFIDIKSFAFGMVCTVIIYFMAIGVYTTVQNSILEKSPNLVKVNKAYSEVISNLESKLVNEQNLKYPQIVIHSNYEEGFERLNGINMAISDLKKVQISSSLKEQKLMKLYKMKLEVIEDLILIEVKNENYN